MKVLAPPLSALPVEFGEPQVCVLCGRVDHDTAGTECAGDDLCPDCHDEHQLECGVCREISMWDAAAEVGLDDERWDW